MNSYGYTWINHFLWDAITHQALWLNRRCVDDMDGFEVKLTFEMLTVRGQQHSFSTQERVFLWKCQSFWDRKCLNLRGGLEPPIFGFMPNAPTYWAIRARHLLSHVFEYMVTSHNFIWMGLLIHGLNSVVIFQISVSKVPARRLDLTSVVIHC